MAIRAKRFGMTGITTLGLSPSLNRVEKAKVLRMISHFNVIALQMTF
jgi:hypothetical protein